MLSSEELIRDPVSAFPAATVACFDPTVGELPRRRLDEQRTIEFLERLAECGVPAVLIGASTGHGHLRTIDELDAWMRCAARADLKSTMKSVLLRPEDGPEGNRHLVQLAAELGYPVIFIRPGRDLPSTASDADVVENMRPLLAAAAQHQLAVGIYSIPDVSGVRLTADAAVRLVEGSDGERIVAVKVTEADYDSSTLSFLKRPELRRLKIVQGWDPHISRALRDGPQYDSQQQQRCGVTSGPMSFAVYQYLHILQAAAEQNWDEVERAQAAVSRLFSAMQDDPRKFADLQRAKFIMGLGQPLTSAVDSEAVDRVVKALKEVPDAADRRRLAKSLNLLRDGPFEKRLREISDE